MVRNNFFTAVAMVMMMMASVNSYAQGTRGGQMMGNRGGNREMAMGAQMGNRGGQMNQRGGQAMMGGNQRMNSRDVQMGAQRRGGEVRMGGMPHVDARGFVPGWEGRVMYRDGRWGYLRGADWFWYDTYFEPDFYFGRPVDYFAPHFIPVDGRVAGAVAATVAVGTLISMLVH